MVPFLGLCLLRVHFQDVGIVGYGYFNRHGLLRRAGSPPRAARGVEPLRSGYAIELDKGESARVELNLNHLRFQLIGPGTFSCLPSRMMVTSGNGELHSLPAVKFPEASAKLKGGIPSGKYEFRGGRWLKLGGTRLRNGTNSDYFGPSGRLLDPSIEANWRTSLPVQRVTLSIHDLAPDVSANMLGPALISQDVESGSTGSYTLDLSRLQKGRPYSLVVQFRTASGETVGGQCSEILIADPADAARIRSERTVFDQIDDPVERELSWMQRCLSYGCYAEALNAISRAEAASPESKDVIAPLKSMVESIAYGAPN